jgi:hypothetical protein
MQHPPLVFWQTGFHAKAHRSTGGTGLSMHSQRSSFHLRPDVLLTRCLEGGNQVQTPLSKGGLGADERPFASRNLYVVQREEEINVSRVDSRATMTPRRVSMNQD